MLKRLAVAFPFGKGEDFVPVDGGEDMRGEEQKLAGDAAAGGTAGYSGTPLVRKLGLAQGQAVALLGITETIGDINGFAGFASASAHCRRSLSVRSIMSICLRQNGGRWRPSRPRFFVS